MARERTADDQVLALLARSALPLECGEVARALGWGNSMASKVLGRLRERLHVSRDVSTGAGGRPSEKFALRSTTAPLPAGVPARIRFEQDTVVVTPSGREARVKLHRRDGWVELVFLDGAREENMLHERLLAAFQPGRARPTPVRIT